MKWVIRSAGESFEGEWIKICNDNLLRYFSLDKSGGTNRPTNIDVFEFNAC